jgi:hypothetical protein
MARKKSTKKAAQAFNEAADAIAEFLTVMKKEQKDEYVSWIYDYGIISLYREFETLMLQAIVSAINNDTETLSTTTGTKFPKHLTDEVCEYLIIGGGYFDFKGRDGLIRELKRYIPELHYLVIAVKKVKYKDALEKLSALRNLAAHGSRASKKAALASVGQQRIGSAGSWLKSQGRFDTIKNALKELASQIESQAPY